jgi:hypothetical protein
VTFQYFGQGCLEERFWAAFGYELMMKVY